jgi:hypothetical protein
MSKKKLDATTMINELKGASLYFQKPIPPIPEQEPAMTVPAAAEEAQPVATEPPEHKATYPSKRLSSFLSNRPSTDQIEQLSFELRKVRKFRVNADIPQAWKDELDDLAHELRVGKYELMTFVVGEWLGTVKRKKRG